MECGCSVCVEEYVLDGCGLLELGLACSLRVLWLCNTYHQN